MAVTNFLRLFAIGCALLLNAACGFRPLYATSPQGEPFRHAIAVQDVNAPDAVRAFLTDRLESRLMLGEGVRPKYDLIVSATETASRLAVQIDATVTRYNYRLNGRYTLVDLETGERITGAANAVTSYNIVRSQYSTLFAERAAQEKAARLLAEDIERAILVSLAEQRKGEGGDETRIDAELDGESEMLMEPRAGEIIETREDQQ